MFNLKIVTAIALGIVLMPAVAHAEENEKLRCPKNDTVEIIIETNIAPTEYDYTKTASEIAYMRVIDSNTPFEFSGSVFQKGGLTESIKIPQKILLGKFAATGLYRPHFQIGYNPEYERKWLNEEQTHFCEYIKKLVISINSKPEIFVVKEAKNINQRRCFKDILKHEEGHHIVSKQHITEYEQKFYDNFRQVIARNKTYSAPLTKEEEGNFYGYMSRQLLANMTKMVFSFHTEHNAKQDRFHASPESDANRYCEEVDESAIKNLKNSRLFND